MGSMHIIQGVSSLNRRKSKQKITKTKMIEFQQAHQKHNKRWKQKGHHDMIMTFDEYLNYRFGKTKKVQQNKTKTSFVPEYCVDLRSNNRKTKSKSSVQASQHACSKSNDDYKRQVSSQYVIGQAYNKGNLVVLLKSEAGDSATGKRR